MQRIVVAALLLAVWAVPGPAAHAADRDRDGVVDTLEAQLATTKKLPVVVALRVSPTAARTRSIEQAVGDLGETTRLDLVDAFAARATPRQIRALAARADVTHVEPDAPVVPFSVGPQNAFGVTRARVDLPALDGSGMVAAVVDSGIDATMADLAGAKVVGFRDLVNNRDGAYDDLGHGSMVSDILAGTGASGPEGRGVAPGASLVGVKVIDRLGQSSLSKIAEGIQWVVDNRDRYGIDALNLSIGDPNGCGDGTDVASKAVDAAVAAGIVVIAAAGNSGPSSCTIKSPAAAESALTVGAMADPSVGGFSLGALSSRGPTADGRTKPDLVAPGIDVTMAIPGGGFYTGSGTSAAAPFVTGVALLMLQAQPTLTPAQIKDAMERTAIDWGAPGRDLEYGSGRLDGYAALRSVGASLAVPPAVPRHEEWAGTVAAGAVAEHPLDVSGGGVPLALTMTAQDAGVDVTLVDPAGAEIVPPTRTERQETISVKVPADGRYLVRVQGTGDFVVDASGALGSPDTIAPELTVDPPARGRLSGAAGSALGDFPGVVARVWKGDQVLRRLVATPLAGRWSVDLTPPLEDGEYSVDVEQGDVSGNVARVPARAFTVDTQAPAVPVVSGSASGHTVTLSGTAEAGSTVKAGASSVVAANGAWVLTFGDVPDGTHTYEVTATDGAGNTSAAATVTVTVDTVGPVVKIDAAPPKLSFVRSPTVRFSAEAGATFECTLTGDWQGCTSPKTLGPLVDGDYTFRVRAKDAVGNLGDEATATFTVDGTAPGKPAIGSAAAVGHQVRLSGTAEPGSTIVLVAGGLPVPGPDIVAGDDGKWSAVLQGVPDGSYTYAATATDAAGNESEASGARVVVVDTVAPAAPVLGGKDLVQNTRVVSLSGTAEPGATIRLSGGTEVVAAGNGTWSAVLVDVPDGRHVYTATATDAAGNGSVASAERVIVVDTVPPTTTVGADGSATSEPGATLECRVDGGVWAPCAASYGGGAPGGHVLEVRATDPAGNVGPVAQYAWTVTPPVTFADPPVTPVGPFSPPAIVVVPRKPTVTVARQSLATVLKRGLAVRVGSKCSVVLSQGKKVLARASGTGTLRLKLSASTRRKLARSKRVRLTLTVTAPGAAAVKRTVTLKR